MAAAAVLTAAAPDADHLEEVLSERPFTPDVSGPVSHKWLVAMAVMLGATLEVLDSSIVNVCLPHMQGSFSASRDEVTWIITSYIVANGIMIPLTGWISVAHRPQALLPVLGSDVRHRLGDYAAPPDR